MNNFQFPISNVKLKQFFIVVFSFTLVCVSLLTNSNVAFGQGGVTVPAPNTGSGVTVPSSGQTTGTITNPLNVKSIGDAINTVLQAVTYLAVLFAVLALIWVGFKFIAAKGNPGKTKEAGQWLGFIVIGIAIILGARLLIAIVINTLQATGTIKPEVIQSANNALTGSSQ